MRSKFRESLQRIVGYLFKSEPLQTGIVSDALAPKREPIQGTDKLYIIDINFPMTPQFAQAIDKQLDPLRKRYGLDFMVIEPGMRLRRFNDL